MKKMFVLLTSLAMVFVLNTAAGATPVPVTFDIDFHTDGFVNPVHNYLKGDWDTGETILLQPSESVWLDIYFTSTHHASHMSGGFLLPFDITNIEVTDYMVTYPPWADLGNTVIDNAAGQVLWEVAKFPPGTPYVQPGDNILLASILFHCTGLSFDELWLFDDPRGPTWLDESGVVLDDEIFVEPIYLGAIHQTPIPGALWLLGSGVLGLVGIRRKVSG